MIDKYDDCSFSCEIYGNPSRATCYTSVQHFGRNDYALFQNSFKPAGRIFTKSLIIITTPLCLNSPPRIMQSYGKNYSSNRCFRCVATISASEIDRSVSQVLVLKTRIVDTKIESVLGESVV